MRAGAGFFKLSGLTFKGPISPELRHAAGVLARHLHSPIGEFLESPPREMFAWMETLELIAKEENPNG